MKCPKCAASSPDESTFCNKCGEKIVPATLSAVDERVGKIESQMSGYRKASAVNQKYLEIDTAEKVMTRVQTWAKLILFFAGIPAAVSLLALAVIFGKGAFDLHKIAANAQASVGSVLARAQSEAADAERIADSALGKSKQTDADIKDTGKMISNLNDELSKRSAEVLTFKRQADEYQSRMDSLKASATDQAQQIQHLTEQVHEVQVEKNIQSVQTVYPIFGEHRALSVSNGWIDPKQKISGETYVDLIFHLSTTLGVTEQKIAETIAGLSDRKYRVYLGQISRMAVTPTSNQSLEDGLDATSCSQWSQAQLPPPCILYFREDIKGAASEVRELVIGIQSIPDDHFVFIDYKKLGAGKRELLDISHVEIVVVLAPVNGTQ